MWIGGRAGTLLATPVRNSRVHEWPLRQDLLSRKTHRSNVLITGATTTCALLLLQLHFITAFTPPAHIFNKMGHFPFFPYNHRLYEFHFFTLTCLTTQSVTHTTQHRMIQLSLNNGEVVAYFQRIYRNNLKELNKITETRYQNSWHRTEIWTWNLRDMKLNCH